MHACMHEHIWNRSTQNTCMYACIYHVCVSIEACSTVLFSVRMRNCCNVYLKFAAALVYLSILLVLLLSLGPFEK